MPADGLVPFRCQGICRHSANQGCNSKTGTWRVNNYHQKSPLLFKLKFYEYHFDQSISSFVTTRIPARSIFGDNLDVKYCSISRQWGMKDGLFQKFEWAFLGLISRSLFPYMAMGQPHHHTRTTSLVKPRLWPSSVNEEMSGWPKEKQHIMT